MYNDDTIQSTWYIAERGVEADGSVTYSIVAVDGTGVESDEDYEFSPRDLLIEDGTRFGRGFKLDGDVLIIPGDARIDDVLTDLDKTYESLVDEYTNYARAEKIWG